MVMLILHSNASPPSSVPTSSESPDSIWTRNGAMAVMGGVGHPDNWYGQMVFTPLSGMAFLKHLVMKIEAKWQNNGLIKLNESSTWILVQFSRESTRLQSPRWRVQGHTFSQLSMFFSGLLSSGTLTRGFMWKLPAVMLSWHGQAHPQLA